MLRRLRLPSVQLALWTCFIWGVRIKNADGSVGAIALSLLLIGLAALVLVTRSGGVVVVLLAGVTIAVWLVRIVDIALLSDHPGAFKVVHVALGLVSMALAARCDAELNGRDRAGLRGRRRAPA